MDTIKLLEYLVPNSVRICTLVVVVTQFLLIDPAGRVIYKRLTAYQLSEFKTTFVQVNFYSARKSQPQILACWRNLPLQISPCSSYLLNYCYLKINPYRICAKKKKSKLRGRG